MTNIMVVADERFGDTYCFAADELERQILECELSFSEFSETDAQNFRDAAEEYDLSEPDDVLEFDYHKDYILKNECWTESAEAIIKTHLAGFTG